MKISIAICTWNRSRLLDQTLSSLSRMSVPDDLSWELIVVDNNSTEAGVNNVLDSWKNKLPLNSVVEKEPGHSASRNRAVQEATGDYLVWTDNDVMVSPNWLSAYHDAFQKHPEAGFFGGPIEPVFEEGQPTWIRDTWKICAPVYATRNLGKTESALGIGKMPYGANFAVRMDLQKKTPYDTQWGRKQSGMLGEDEVSVLRHLLGEGVMGYWVPDASLHHMIPKDRATVGYVASYFYGQGQANALKGNITRSAARIWWDGWKSLCGYYLRKPVAPPINWLSNRVHAAICWGELAGLRSLVKRESIAPDESKDCPPS